jgi:hypothetical protein
MYLKRYNELEIVSLFRHNYRAKFYLREISKRSKLPLKTELQKVVKAGWIRILLEKV